MEVLEDRTVPTAVGVPSGLATGPLLPSYGQLPLRFEANQGQTDAQVSFLARGSGYSLFLTPDQAVLRLQKLSADPRAGAGLPAGPGEVLRMQLVGANPAPQVAGLYELAAKSNYLIGNDPRRWHTDVPNYGRVAFRGVYPGVDLVYYGNQGQLEYDFVVAPGADPGAVRLAFQGAEAITLDAEGNLVLHTAGGDVVEHAPVLYQEAGGVRRAVSGHYVLVGADQLGFAVAGYDAGQPLTIDPVLSYSTFLGGSGLEEADGIAVDWAGSAYVAGVTQSANFPTTPGAFQTTKAGGNDVFVAKLSADGSGLVYSTFLGGGGFDGASGIAVDGAGNAYVAGLTQSADFPTTPGAFQTTYGGNGDAFVAQLSADGSALVYSTFLGGSGGDIANGIAVDGAGSAYVAGSTTSSDFPTTPGAFQTTYGGGLVNGDAFVAKLSADGSTLAYSTYLGGSSGDVADGIAVDGAGGAYVAGYTNSADFPTTPGAFQTTYGGNGDAFVAQLSADGSALVYSTFLGGSNGDYANAIAVDGTGSAYVAGTTYSADFPTTPGAFQTTKNGNSNAFVARLSADGSGLVYSTLLGGSGEDGAIGIAVDGAGSAYLAGQTYSANFPTTPDAYQTTYGGGSNFGDAFVARLSPDGSALAYSTYLGGSGDDVARAIALDGAGGAYVAGSTVSADFPTTPGAFQTTKGGSWDAFVARFDFSASGPVAPTHRRGNGGDQALRIAEGDASADFPTTPGAFSVPRAGLLEAFLADLDAAGSGRVDATSLSGKPDDYTVACAGDSACSAAVVFKLAPGNGVPLPEASVFDNGAGTTLADARHDLLWDNWSLEAFGADPLTEPVG
jgi:hypothetical protein